MCFNVVVAFDQIVKMNKPTEKQKENNRDQAVDQGYQGKYPVTQEIFYIFVP